MDYDVIGDLHGQADKLEALLRTLGYRETSGAWRHPERQALFVGDFIDRGPAQVRTVETVRRMVDAGSALAVMGNHELNAIAWFTPDEHHPGEFLRPHHSAHFGEKNRQQHAAFLAEVEDKPTLHRELISWFLQLPLWIELPSLRVVHACWHAPLIDWLRPQLRDQRFLSADLLGEATRAIEPAAEGVTQPSLFQAVEVLTKGIEIPLPAPHFFLDKDGHRRTQVRVRWWESAAHTYCTAAIMPDDLRACLPEDPIPSWAQVTLDAVPTFFGHYWMTGLPAPLSDVAACVDYSAGRGGPLVAYRFDGASQLAQSNFVAVP